jgi:acyl carrier protein
MFSKANIRDDVLRVVNKQLKVNLSRDEIKLKLRKDLNMYYSDLVNVVIQLEMKYHLVIPDDDMNGFNSLDEIIRFIFKNAEVPDEEVVV